MIGGGGCARANGIFAKHRGSWFGFRIEIETGSQTYGLGPRDMGIADTQQFNIGLTGRYLGDMHCVYSGGMLYGGKG